jgi:hypothetical protein
MRAVARDNEDQRAKRLTFGHVRRRGGWPSMSGSALDERPGLNPPG